MPGSAQTAVCHEDILSYDCLCDACAATALNLQVTPTCNGPELTWNDIGADRYIVAVYYPAQNDWYPILELSGTGYSITNDDIPSGIYSFAIVPHNQPRNMSKHPRIPVNRFTSYYDHRIPGSRALHPENPGKLNIFNLISIVFYQMGQTGIFP